MNDPRGLAPQGWRIPTEGDWNKLVKFIDPAADTTCSSCTNQSRTAGGALKSTSGWNSPNTGATNSSGFSGLPAGGRLSNGVFTSFGSNGNWWSATEYNSFFAYFRELYNANTDLVKFYTYKASGLSVRVVRD